MKRLLFSALVATTAGLFLLPGVAFASPPETIHFRDVGTDVDPDFCGTGQEVEVAFDVVGNIWFRPEAPFDLFKVTLSGKETWTNPETGQSAFVSFAGQFTDRVIAGDPFGLHTHLLTFKGLPVKIKTSTGPVLLRDAGFISLAVTSDFGEEPISEEIVVNRGPHPDAESGFMLFCDVMTGALGIA